MQDVKAKASLSGELKDVFCFLEMNSEGGGSARES